MEALFRRLVTDLNAVHDAYESAGLLSDAGPGSLAWTLFGSPEDADRFRRDALLADALVRHRVARLALDRAGTAPVRLRHIVVFGGNNVGKSTVVNILAAASLASTSPEGGHTRHAQAYTAASLPLFAWNPYAFSRFSQVAASQLPDDRFECYSVSATGTGVLPDDVVLWDSPDCDSVGSGRYLESVVEAVAAADVVVYVTSVEKYAVADLVEWLFDLHDAGIPILECLNKTPARDRPLVIRKQTDDVFPAVARRIGLPAPSPQVIALGYMTEGEEADLWGADHPEATELREAALSALTAQDERVVAERALQSVQRRLERVLEPARMELSARRAWTGIVGSAVAAFLTIYENQYLAGSVVIDPFKKLNAELLELLNPDIPHLSEVIRRLRAVQRIPAHLLRAAWRLGANFISDNNEAGNDAKLAPELRAYATAHRALLGLIHDSIEQQRAASRHHPFWDQVAASWDGQAARLADEFARATVIHMKQTDAEIRAAAQDILQALRQRPHVVRLLRAARVSTDIGGLLIGFILPGHGSVVQDLLKDIVIAPAMLGATGFAAEYAVEGYVAQRRSQVVERLRADAREMAVSLYSMPLEAVADAVMTRVGKLGIEQEHLDRVAADLLSLQQEFARLPDRAPA